jgi:hypothetical protein
MIDAMIDGCPGMVCVSARAIQAKESDAIRTDIEAIDLASEFIASV